MRLVSIFRGFFLAHSMHVVTPGRASNLAGAMGWPQSVQARVCFRSFAIRTSKQDIAITLANSTLVGNAANVSGIWSRFGCVRFLGYDLSKWTMSLTDSR